MAEHKPTREFLSTLAFQDNVVVTGQILLEFYLLIRNPKIFTRPLGAHQATEVCQQYRRNPRWRLVECYSVMDDVWKHAARASFPRRNIIDVRLGLTLAAAGVTDFATRNVKDFQDLGIIRVFYPID